jgi:hypothetical protein
VTSYSDYVVEYCGTYGGSASDGKGTGTAQYGSLPCAGYAYDIWQFTGVAGNTATITVDTVAADTAFDAKMWINGPDACEIINKDLYTVVPYEYTYPDGTTATFDLYWGAGDDDFACTYAPPSPYGCPAWTVDTEEGAYEVVVGSWADCSGTDGDYSIRVGLTDGTTETDAGLTQTGDDVPWSTSVEYSYPTTFTVTGELSLQP